MHDGPPPSPCPPLDRHPHGPVRHHRHPSGPPAGAVQPHEPVPGPLHRRRLPRGQGDVRPRPPAGPGIRRPDPLAVPASHDTVL